MVLKREKLASGATVSVNDHRVRVDLPTLKSSPAYQSISSAILNGGSRTFYATTTTTSSPSKSPSLTAAHVINYKVPATYNGYDPAPLDLLGNFAKKELLDAENTVGLLTAASMETFSRASRTAQGVSVDAIVTAGLSNSRSAGAEADYCRVLEDVVVAEEEQEQEIMTPGTINTIIIVNAPLTPGALAEAYAIAVEAKCNACVDHGVVCAKDATKFGMGTGTDCCVLVTHCCDATTERVVKHCGKHTLFAEIIGQAVYEATSEAIMINVLHSHGNYAAYTLHRWKKIVIATMKGARPCIPPKPMMPIPSAQPSILLMGISSVLLVYASPLPDKAKMLLAAVAWDRYLGEPPIGLHPVCLCGSAISACTARVPDNVYKSPALGFICGYMFLTTMLAVFLTGAWVFLECADALAEHGPILFDKVCFGYCNKALVDAAFELLVWVLKLLLFKSTFSLQLLCTIALQMARFLERDQIDDARAQLSWLCSRDPSKLGASDLAGGTLESLSENLSDGFVAPLFWYVLLGPLGSLGYRIANGLDSRIGYHGKFEWFGKPSARFDDLTNLIPARITALLLAFAALFVKRCDASKGLKTAWKDCSQCESPNAGWPMACFAGILGVKLKKEGAYCLGSAGVDPGPANIRAGHQVAHIAGGLTVAVAVLASLLVTPSS